VDVLHNNLNSDSHTIDYQKDIYIPQEKFKIHISKVLFTILCNDNTFIKTNIALESFNEGKAYADKLQKLEDSIAVELNKYTSKTLQDSNATLRRLREEKANLEALLINNEEYQKYKNFDFHTLSNLIKDIPNNEVEIYKQNKKNLESIAVRFQKDIENTTTKIFEKYSNDIDIIPYLVIDSNILKLTCDKSTEDVIIEFGKIHFTKSIFAKYRNIPENLNKLSSKEEKSYPKFIKQLNQSQQFAVTYPLEHILVLAGAGCGKTKTIISRAAWLVSQNIAPERIQILTFTKKAASEIVERVNNCLEQSLYGLNASTFHRWCVDILKSAPEIFGYKNFSIIDRDEQLQLFKRIRTEMKISKEIQFPKNAKILDAYSYARNTRKSLSQVMQIQLSDFLSSQDRIALIMKHYETEKRNRNYLDYDDILDIVSTAINQNEEVCKWLGSKYDCILVDEMQDTNPLQWELLEPLSKYAKLFCVGDDAQSIYGFRGADFENIHSFQNRIPDSVIIKLEDNYRSTQEILDVSNWLLKSSPIKYNKELKAVKGKGIKPELHSFVNIFDEASWIVKDLLTRYKKDSLWTNKLVLVRSAYSGRNIEIECLKESIPYIFIGGQKLMESAHIKDLLSLLRIVANYKDDLAWFRFLNLFPGIGEVTANKIINQISSCDKQSEVLDLLNNKIQESFGLKEIYKNLTEIESLEDSIDMALDFLDEILMFKYGKNEWLARKNDFTFLKQLSPQFKSINELIEEFLLNPIFSSQNNEKKDTLVISTIHSAKGTESDIVYVSDVSIGKYPSIRDSSIDEREEERRVLYVALTRAKKELIITRNNFESDFIDEDALYYLRTQYFLNVLPEGLLKEVHHKKQAIEVHRVHTSFSDEDIKELPEKYRIRVSNVKQKIEQSSQNNNSIKIMTNNASSEEKNPLIVEYMKTRKFGDAYPNEIKAAIVAEYIPKVYGYKKIGKKYGINPDVIKHWITFGL
jgi:DNA helicase-2/ATP-dependent DNA helicase PcrA